MSSEEWVLNPKTNRMVKKNSITHRRLINQGVFKRTKPDDDVVHVIQENDDVGEIKKQLSVDLPENMNIRRGHGRNKGKLVKGFRSGRPKSPPVPKRQRQTAEDLTEEEVRKLNKQQTTATTMEACDLLYINRVESMKVLLGGMQDSVLVERLSFLNKIDLFKGINRNHLLPLVSNLIIKRYRKG